MQIDPNSQYPQRSGFRISPRLIIVVIIAIVMAFKWMHSAQVQPETGQKVHIDPGITPQQESQMGLQAYQDVLQQEQPVDPNSQIAQQVRAIAQRLITVIPQVEDALAQEHGTQSQHVERNFEWQETLLKSDEANAFCLPGGKIAVYTGLLPIAQNANAVAIVLGHEISHALLRHGAQRMTRQKLEQLGAMAGAVSGMDPNVQQAVFSAYGVTSQLPYARSQETQADEMGLLIAAAACFDPREAIPLWQRMDQTSGGNAPPEYASTHPSAGTRMKDLQALMPKAMEYRQRFCKDPAAAGGALPATQ